MGKALLTVGKETELIVYGAGLKGEMFIEIAAEIGLQVIAYLDRKAMYMQDRRDIPIYEPATPQISMEKRQKAVVIISVNDIFSHEEIANMLVKQGFSYILYKPNMLKALSEKELKISDIFDAFYLDRKLLGAEIPSYIEKKENKICPDIVRESKEHFMIYEPAEILFTNSKAAFLRKFQGINEQINQTSNILSYLYCGELFKGYEDGMNLEEWQRFIEIYQEGSFSYLNGEHQREAFRRHMQSRYKIYQTMIKAFQINPLFFEQSPVIIEQNDYGRLVIKDGANRTAFLLAKGMFWIPCRVEKNLYKELYHEEAMHDLLNYLKDNAIKELPLPIAHSSFQRYSFHYDIYAQKVLYAICQYLEKKELRIEHKMVLDCNALNGYYAQFWDRMDNKVVAIEDDPILIKVFEMVNTLLRCKNIKIIPTVEQTTEKFQIVFLHHLQDDVNLLETLLKKTISSETECCFVEVKEESSSDQYLRQKYQNRETVLQLVLADSVMKIYSIYQEK